jgi:DNA-binding transcriptional ArsR family regulator
MKVRDIYSLLSIEQALVSQQLRILRLAEVVHSRRSQKFIFYRLNYDKLALVAHNAPLLAVLVQQ